MTDSVDSRAVEDWGEIPVGPHVTVHLVRHGLVENPDGILYGRIPGYHLSDVGVKMAERLGEYFGHRAGAISYLAASPLERAVETMAPIAAAVDLEVVSDGRLVEGANIFEGTPFAVGDGVLKKPRNWKQVRDPFTPSWGEPYIHIARRMLASVYDAVRAASGDGAGLGEGGRDAEGREAVLVSHQLPIWTLRRYLEGKRLWHNPAKRQCSLASVTSLHFRGGVLVGLRYAEPAKDLLPASTKGATGA